jgi:hypothetical protein
MRVSRRSLPEVPAVGGLGGVCLASAPETTRGG